MKQIALAISEAKSVQSPQWDHCIYETWWDNNCCQKWWFTVKYGTHLAENVGDEWLHEVRVSGDEAVSKTASLPQRKVKYWNFSDGSETLHEARALWPHHCISKIIVQFWSVQENKCCRSWAIPEVIVLPYWLEKVSDKRRDCPPDQSLLAHMSSVSLSMLQSKSWTR